MSSIASLRGETRGDGGRRALILSISHISISYNYYYYYNSYYGYPAGEDGIYCWVSLISDYQGNLFVRIRQIEKVTGSTI